MFLTRLHVNVESRQPNINVSNVWSESLVMCPKIVSVTQNNSTHVAATNTLKNMHIHDTHTS